jgi:hypothetical protein
VKPDLARRHPRGGNLGTVAEMREHHKTVSNFAGRQSPRCGITNGGAHRTVPFSDPPSGNAAGSCERLELHDLSITRFHAIMLAGTADSAGHTPDFRCRGAAVAQVS